MSDMQLGQSATFVSSEIDGFRLFPSPPYLEAAVVKTHLLFPWANAYLWSLCVRPDVMAHACNLSIGRLKQDNQFETSLGSALFFTSKHRSKQAHPNQQWVTRLIDCIHAEASACFPVLCPVLPTSVPACLPLVFACSSLVMIIDIIIKGSAYIILNYSFHQIIPFSILGSYKIYFWNHLFIFCY